jgi:hypothetical protein
MKIRTILRKGPDGIEESADEATGVEKSFEADVIATSPCNSKRQRGRTLHK